MVPPTSLTFQVEHDEPDSSIAPTSASEDGYISTGHEGPTPATHSEHDRNMGRFGLPLKSPSASKSHIDIVVDSPYLTLKGTGPDVEPTHLSGNVVLFLAEATTIKEITLEFRGKAKIPIPTNESLINNGGGSLSYNVCNHTWSFLDLGIGSKHSAARTLKAGRHHFPFSLEIGGSLPSSIDTPLFSGAHVHYKLHAAATLPHKLFSTHLHHTTPITLIRSLSPLALEYQQTLEIENSWPGKLMYSIILPHKAWAQGDTLGVLVKFSPTAKGVSVHSILSNIEEKTRVYSRGGEREEKRIVASAKHEIVGNKRAVLVDANKPSLWIGFASPPRTPPQQPHDDVSGASSSSAAGPSSHSIPPSLSTSAFPPFASGSSSPIPSTPSTSSSSSDLAEDPHAAPTDLVTTLFFPLPATSPAILPSHSLEPITVSHRIRWAIYISNPDGHISELRCSLPLTILDGRLLAESRTHTSLTRRSVLASGGLVAEAIAGNDGEQRTGDGEEGDLDLEDRELPSYNAHVRDRVANMYLPEGWTTRVTNPWVINGTSPTSPVAAVGHSDQSIMSVLSGDESSSSMNNPTSDGEDSTGRSPLQTSRSASSIWSMNAQAQPRPHQYSAPATASSSFFIPSGRQQASRPVSGYSTPLDSSVAHGMSHLPQAPRHGDSTPLDWVNSELLLSLSDNPGSRFEREIERSRGGGGASSGGESRTNSRPMSPVAGSSGEGSRPTSSHGLNNHHNHHHHHHHHKHGFGGLIKGAIKGLGFTKHHHDDHHHDHDHHHASGSGSVATSPPSSTSVRPRSQNHSPVREAQRPVRPIPTRTRTAGAASSSTVTQHHVTFSSAPGSPRHEYGSLPRGHSPLSPQAAATNDAVAQVDNRDGDLLHRAFTEVPDYSVAARGFIGGVAPLSSLIGLPSYADVAREMQREATTRV